MASCKNEFLCTLSWDSLILGYCFALWTNIELRTSSGLNQSEFLLWPMLQILLLTSNWTLKKEKGEKRWFKLKFEKYNVNNNLIFFTFHCCNNFVNFFAINLKNWFCMKRIISNFEWKNYELIKFAYNQLWVETFLFVGHKKVTKWCEWRSNILDGFR